MDKENVFSLEENHPWVLHWAMCFWAFCPYLSRIAFQQGGEWTVF